MVNVAEEKPSGLTEEVKGVSQEFVNSLGVIELILGSVTMYGIWILYKTSVSKLFPSTGIVFVDVGLLAFGAALLGKIVDLLVAIIMAIGRRIISQGNIFGYYASIQKSLIELQILPIQSSELDAIDTGSYYVILRDPNQRAVFERLRARVVIEYSATILMIPYLIYFSRESTPTALLSLTIVGSMFLIVLGFLQQLDYLKTLSERLRVLGKIQREAPPQAGEVGARAP